MIECYAYARAGLLGNPSDGYFGKTISFLVRNFRARVLLYPSARLEIRPSKADMPVFENLEDLYKTTRWRGYYGGIRIIQALLVRFLDYCAEQGIEIEDRNFTLEYETNIPLRLGMGGSSSIITAALRAIMQYYGIAIPLPVQAKLILETETRELGVPAGLQDRVIQVYEGLVYMDFSRELMERQDHGNYEKLDPACLPDMYVAYRTSLSEGTEVFHNDVRERWRRGDPEVTDAMQEWASIAERGKTAILNRDYGLLDELINRNFDLRATLYRISPGNLEMVETARRAGASANFAGSGGAIVGSYRGEDMFRQLTAAMQNIGVAVIKPRIDAGRTNHIDLRSCADSAR
ncbi:MAG: GHMP kinase [Bryobacteraceae bacterium]|nr:GHMP kinase [Bryobacteraceae bacterium]